MVADYYAILGIDPGADRGAVEAALAKCQPMWSSGTRNPKNKHTYQSYLDQIPALRRALLSDPAARAAYDAELSASRRAEREQNLDALQRLVRLRAAKGGLSDADRTLLRDRAVQQGLTAADLDRLADPYPTQAAPRADQDPPDPPVDALDLGMRRQIRVTLEHLRRRDLYDVLGVERDAPGEEIAAKADAERKRWMQKAQVTAEKTAWLEVVSHAQSHLGNAQARARYDRTLHLEAEDTLNTAIEFAVKGLQHLDPGTRNALLDEASALGITPERADRLIGRSCRTLGVAREFTVAPAAAVSPRYLRCRACGGMTDFGRVARQKAPACRHCDASLRWDCPICHKTRWVDEPRCDCGFRLEHRDPLVRHFEAAQHAYKARDIDSALAHLQRIQEFAPLHVGTRKAIERINGQREQVEQARAAWESARAARKLIAATDAVERWARLAPSGDPDIRAARAEITRTIREAHALSGRAHAREQLDPRGARDLYRQALAIAADLPEALDGLRRTPPDHPTDLAAEYTGDRVRLRWSSPPPDGLGTVAFTILRRPGGPIQHLGDGTRIAQLTGTEYEDTDVAAGATVSYAVLSTRGGIDSVAATSLGPIDLVADPTDVRVRAGDREVDLSWSLPPGAFDVRVLRKLGVRPSGPKDGEPVETLRDRAHDHRVENDRVYHYGLHAIYKRPDGRMLVSHGVVVSAQPHPPAQVLAAPSLAQEAGGRLRLDWPEPARGTVKIRRTEASLPHPPGHRLSIAEAEATPGVWLDDSAVDHAYDPDPPGTGACHYTPLVAVGGMLTVGQSVAYSCVPDPSELRAVRIGNGRVNLRWRWSGRGAYSLVVARAGSPPAGPDDPESLRTTVHEVEYSRLGHHPLNLPTDREGPWHIRVYSVAQAAGESVLSPGLEPTATTIVPGPHPEVTVSYTFRRPGFPGRTWSVLFHTSPPGSPIPPTVLVVHPRTVPLAADDGEILQQFPAANDAASFPILAKGNFAKLRARIFADPHADSSTISPIRFRHPESDPVRV